MFRYCKYTNEFQHDTLWNILGGSFDFNVWVLLVVACVLILITLANHADSTYLHATFEVVALCLQRTCSRGYFGAVLLIGFFFIEFYYLGYITENIVKPPDRHIMSTLTEALHNGLKLRLGTLANLGALKTGEIHALRRDLAKEGLKGGLFAKNEEGISIYFVKFSSFPEYLARYAHFKLYGKRLDSFVMENRTCDFVNTRYLPSHWFIQVDSKLRLLFRQTLQRLLYESGIHYYWIAAQHKKGEANRKKQEPHEAKVVAVKFRDGRFQALLQITAFALFFCIIGAAIESKGRVRSGLLKILTWIYMLRRKFVAGLRSSLTNRASPNQKIEVETASD